MGHSVTWALLFMGSLAAPFVVPAIVTLLFVGRARRKREAIAAREQVGRLGEG